MNDLVLSDDERDRAGARLLGLLDRYERELPDTPLLPALDRERLADLLAAPVPEEGVGVDAFFDRLERSSSPTPPPWRTRASSPTCWGRPTASHRTPRPSRPRSTRTATSGSCRPRPASSSGRCCGGWPRSWGYPDTARGSFTGGGSLATLDALVTALHHRLPDYRAVGLQRPGPPLVLYTSTEAHRSVDKAAAIVGIGLDNVRHIPTDDQHRMRATALADAVEADRRAGLRPFCVVATCGTVATGAVDPIGAIADLCAAQDLWLHVDGAYGALFLLCEQMRDLMGACARADSIALDPHKLLFAPLEAGCLLVRDGARLRDAYAFPSSYLTTADDPLMTDYMDYGPQLSRSFKALKVWSALHTFGVNAFRTATHRTLELAQRLARGIDATPGLHLLAPTTLTAVCFALDNGSRTDHGALLAKLAEDNTALFGPVVVAGRHGLRACVTNHRTTAADIDLILDRLR